jgi:hypothetical protein
MAYLADKGFRYDVFFSYAHIDDEGQGEEKWITIFTRKLKITLEKLIGKEVDFWIDEDNLRGNHAYDDEIHEKINQSAVFILCTSNSYNNSFYCKQEFDWFSANAQTSPIGLKVKNMFRISNILLYDVPIASWAQIIGRSAGYAAFEKLTSTSMGKPLDVASKEFNIIVQRVAEDIKDILFSIAESGSKKKVFFANVSKTLADTKKRIINEISNQNTDIQIISDIPPPEDELEHETKVLQILNDSCLSVHLLNDLPGREINDKLDTYLQKQAELAISSSVPQLIWVPKNLNLIPDEVENSHHLNFLKKIDGEEFNKKGISYIRGNESDLTREILNKLKEVLIEKVPTDPSQVENKELTLLLETHQKDYSTTFPMVDILINNKITPEINCEVDNQGTGLTRLEDKMSKVNSFLTIIGNAPQTSISRLDSCIQLMLKYEMKAQAIYLAPKLYDRMNEDMKRKISIYKRFNFLILDDSRNNEFNPDTFNSFVQIIAGVKESS